MTQLNRDELIEKISEVILETTNFSYISTNYGNCNLKINNPTDISKAILKALGEYLPTADELHHRNLFVMDTYKEFKNICEGK